MQQHGRTPILASASRRLAARPEAAWLLAWCVLCLPWLAGVKTIPFDAVQQFFPAVSFTAEQLRHLQAPWWNPYLYSGYPQLADPQMMTFQPSMILPMMPAPTSLHLFTVVVLLHVLAGGLGALRLARSWGLSVAPQLLFALVLAVGGVAASRLQHTPMIISYSVLPWLWLGLDQLRRRGRIGDVLLAGIAGGLCALQLTQVTYFIILACAIYACAALLVARDSRGRLALHLSAVAVIAALISAPQWLSTLAWLGETNRDGLSLQAALPGALHLQSLATLLSGNVFAQGRGDNWAFGDVTTDYLYMGAVPLALWLAWGGRVVQQHPAAARIALATLVLAVLVALGGATPLFPWLFTVLPGLDLFRRPSDALFLTVPAAAWLAAYALQAAVQRARLQPHLPSVLALAVLLVYTGWLVVAAGQMQSFAWMAISGAIGGGALYLLRRHAHPLRWVFALVMLDMILFNVSTAFNTRSSRNVVLDATRDAPSQRAFALLVRERGEGLPERAVVFGLGTLTNGAAAHGLPLANGYNPLLDVRYQAMAGMPAEPVDAFQQKPATPWAADMDAPLFHLLGVRWLLSAQAFAGAQAQGEGLYVARRADVLPRTLNPHTVRRHADDLPPADDYGRTDFQQVVWLPASVSTACPDADAGNVQVLSHRYRAGAMTLQLVADEPGWLVVNELHAPGWVATLESGLGLPIVRGNGLFRAICVPQGQHTLRLRYSPLQLWREGLGQRLADRRGH
ncbi:hypothetical protein C1931_17460 [Stenotrophomonas sp. YAU14A_MKIMI4_1]|nr:hypothetical protein C1931_17460 [Stenotrophomonas sp. YAU14A_MKIMI4_1]